jgi:AMP nucleosidase
MRDLFDLPDLAAMDDGIANGTHDPGPGEPHPLALFTAPRVDYSLHRLRHYTGTSPDHFQNFVLFTNYQFYVDEFVKLGHAMMAGTAGAHEYEAFVEPGNLVTRPAGRPARAADTSGAPPARQGERDREPAPPPRDSTQTISNSPAAPMPPPTHIVITAHLPPRRLPSISA